MSESKIEMWFLYIYYDFTLVLSVKIIFELMRQRPNLMLTLLHIWPYIPNPDITLFPNPDGEWDVTQW